MAIEYICINSYNPQNNEYFSLQQDAISYAEENDEITAIVKATYEPVYEEETIWEREKDRPLTRTEVLFYNCIAYIEQLVDGYEETLDTFRRIGFTDQELIDHEIRDFYLEEELERMRGE